MKPEIETRAIARGLEFVGEFTECWRVLQPHGHEVLVMFSHVATTSRSLRLRATARRIGQHLASKWLERQSIPHDAHELFSVAMGAWAAADLGKCDSAFQLRIEAAFTRRDVARILRFDPRLEGPPDNLPAECSGCSSINARGHRTCVVCHRSLKFETRYAVWSYALVVAYQCERFGPPIGVSLIDVVRWICDMRPYPAGEVDTLSTWDAAFAVTHLVYVLNDYNRWQLRPEWLRPEYEFLRKLLAKAFDSDTIDLLGECVDTLAAFGLSRTGRVLRPAVRYLSSAQNDDGSWGPESADDYTRIHTTWTAIDGIREHKWLRRRPPHRAYFALSEFRRRTVYDSECPFGSPPASDVSTT